MGRRSGKVREESYVEKVSSIAEYCLMANVRRDPMVTDKRDWRNRRNNIRRSAFAAVS
jgi:hypothetical protein